MTPVSPTSPPVGADAPTEWRLRGRGLTGRLMPLAALPFLAVSGLLNWFGSGDRTLGDVLRLVASMLLVVVAVLAVTLAVRTRVRLLPDGVEVRATRTRLYRWQDIQRVLLDLPGKPRAVVLELADDARRRVVLPAPSGFLVRPSENQVLVAYRLLREQHLGRRP